MKAIMQDEMTPPARENMGSAASDDLFGDYDHDHDRERKYNLIAVDPPWKYRGGKRQGVIGTTANNSYPTMTGAEMAKMDVGPRMAADDAVMLMWTTGPQMPTALDLIQAWGFRYVTTFLTWIKVAKDGSTRLMCGQYTRGNPEFVLLATRGKVKQFMVDTKKNASSVLYARVRQHSRKPDAFFKRVAQVFDVANMRKLEMFARKSRPGWDTHGNERTKFDHHHHHQVVGVTKKSKKKNKNRTH